MHYHLLQILVCSLELRELICVGHVANRTAWPPEIEVIRDRAQCGKIETDKQKQENRSTCW